MALNLEAGQMDQLRKAVEECARNSMAILGKIKGGYSDNVGAAWNGPAAIAALGKQDEFEGDWKPLEAILSKLQEGITGTKLRITGLAEDQRDGIQAVSATDGGGNPNAGRYQRL